ncbi:MAG TPA: hypothetical protein DCY89_07515 [Gammaproteobacteria bacterium]|nr:hypothetical protein [Gammaproteobacteria bacterium]
MLAVLLCLSRPVSGELLYQWQDPRTGTTQFSGQPPGWYRSDRVNGPRVLVFHRGQLVDDTAVPVTEDRRAALRAEAIAVAGGGDAPPAAGSLVATPGRADVPGTAVAATSDAAEVPAETTDAAAGVADAGEGASTPADDRERAREVLERFDAAQLAAVRAMVDALLPAAAPAPDASAGPAAVPGARPAGIATDAPADTPVRSGP